MNNYSLVIKASSENDPAITIDLLSIKKTALILRAINHKLRQVILKLIDDNDKITVTEIYTHLRLEQSVASQHLAILRKAGLVKTKRNGKFIYYSVNKQRLLELNKFVKDFLA